MSVIGNPLLLSPEGYQIERSVRLRSSASAYFNRTPASAGNRKTWTWSGWVKVGTLGVNRGLFGAQTTAGADANRLLVWLNSSDKIIVYEDISSTGNTYRLTTQVFRDPSAWYHIVLAFDTSNATAGDRVKLYVNGSQITTFDTNNAPTLNRDTFVNAALPHSLGADRASSLVAFDGYLTEVNFIDGQALTPSSFGETDAVTGVWKPKKYAGTYGTNGFYLNFSDPSAATAAAIGKDSSGNGNNWTPNNISVTAGVTYDSMIDTPTPYADRGNFATWNPLEPNAGLGGGIVDGNLLGFPANTSGTGQLKATINFPASGKFYFEVTPTVITSATAVIGILKTSISVSATPSSAGDMYAYQGDGNKWNGSSTSAYGATYTTNDVIGVAFDIDSGTITFYKNGTTQGQAYSGITGEYVAAARDGTTGGVTQYAINFGQRPFAYTPPTGFKALNTQNLPEPTIVDGSQYMDVSLYTGTGASQSITNSGGMQPDWVWIKSRNNASNNALIDSVRGGNKLLISELTDAEYTGTYLSSFDSSGFTIGATASSSVNASGYTYVGWQWKAGGTAVSNTDGSITSTVSAGVTQGFSVVTYTGTGANATVGHGLGVAPKMVIVKLRSPSGGAWGVYHASVGPTGALFLDQTAAVNTFSTFWNNTAPTSTVFTIGSNGNINQVNPFVAYCFAEVPGFSKFGSYTGNGSTDGPFVFCGFRPRFVLIKLTSSGGYNWVIIDTSRSPVNTTDDWLFPNLSSAEVTQSDLYVDVLSNGFKHRQTNANVNASGATYIYAAFAEHPFKNALAR